MRNETITLVVFASCQVACNTSGRRLSELRDRYDEVRATPEGTVVDKGGGDVSFLVGMRRATIRESLGLPYNCLRPATCDDEPDWDYGFSRARPNTRGGGGSELVLKFDGDRCVDAGWGYAK